MEKEKIKKETSFDALFLISILSVGLISMIISSVILFFNNKGQNHELFMFFFVIGLLFILLSFLNLYSYRKSMFIDESEAEDQIVLAIEMRKFAEEYMSESLGLTREAFLEAYNKRKEKENVGSS